MKAGDRIIGSKASLDNFLCGRIDLGVVHCNEEHNYGQPPGQGAAKTKRPAVKHQNKLSLRIVGRPLKGCGVKLLDNAAAAASPRAWSLGTLER